jgi:putative peptidoglycan lipid II flippase
MTAPEPTQTEFRAEAAGLVRAASLIAAGNVVSRVLGLVRETVIASLFGATGLVSAFRIAQIIPTMLYDLLIGGMVSSALVPVFSEKAERDRNELWHIASLILSLATLVLSLVVALIELAAPQVAALMAAGFDAELLATTTTLLRLTTPAVFFLSISGILTGLLHALRRFTLPAFTATTFNAIIVMVAVAGVNLFGWGIEALAYGLLLGALGQVGLQLPGLRDARLRFSLDLRHPALGQIGRLTWPILLGLVSSQVAIIIDRSLASTTGEQSIAWMQFATTIIQFPLGLISAAISLAILPTLSRLASSVSGGDGRAAREFMSTLVLGLRLVLVLIIPATVALFVLAEPVVGLLFERGEFRAFDTQQTALALRYYLLGLTFAAIDQPLIFTYYARQNTLTPAVVGLLGVGFYLVAALLPVLFRPLQMTDLVLANSVQLTGHALVMLWLVHRLGSLRGHRLGITTLKALLSATVMGLGLWWALLLGQQWAPGGGFASQAAYFALLIGWGGGIYFGMAVLLRMPEVALLRQMGQRLRPK